MRDFVLPGAKEQVTPMASVRYHLSDFICRFESWTAVGAIILALRQLVAHDLRTYGDGFATVSS